MQAKCQKHAHAGSEFQCSALTVYPAPAHHLQAPDAVWSRPVHWDEFARQGATPEARAQLGRTAATTRERMPLCFRFVVGYHTPVIVWLRSKRTASCVMSKQSASLVTSAPSPGRKLHHTIKVASSACSELPSPVTATLMSARTASGRGGHGRPHSPTPQTVHI